MVATLGSVYTSMASSLKLSWHEFTGFSGWYNLSLCWNSYTFFPSLLAVRNKRPAWISLSSNFTSCRSIIFDCGPGSNSNAEHGLTSTIDSAFFLDRLLVSCFSSVSEPFGAFFEGVSSSCGASHPPTSSHYSSFSNSHSSR